MPSQIYIDLLSSYEHKRRFLENNPSLSLHNASSKLMLQKLKLITMVIHMTPVDESMSSEVK